MASSDPNSINTLRQELPESAYILKTRAPHGGDLMSQLDDMKHEKKMFNKFCSILFGKDQELAQSGTSQNRGGVSGHGADAGADDNTKQPHGPELVTLAAEFWLPAYLKKREKASPGYIPNDRFKKLQRLKMAYEEVMKLGDDVATDVAKVFAKMDIAHVEFLLRHREDLRSTFRGIVKDMKQKETGLPNQVLLPDLELLPQIENQMHRRRL